MFSTTESTASQAEDSVQAAPRLHELAADGPILVWRQGEPGTDIDSVLAVQISRAFTEVLTVPHSSPIVNGSAQWMANGGYLMLHLPGEGPYATNQISDGSMRKACPRWLVDGKWQPLNELNAQPVLSDKAETTYVGSLYGLVEANFFSCRLKVLVPEAVPYGGVTSYCPARGLWAIEWPTSPHLSDSYDTLVHDRDFKELAIIKGASRGTWSPDCSQLLVAGVDGWHIVEVDDWGTKVKVLGKKLSTDRMTGDLDQIVSRPSWSPDGGRFVYSISASSNPQDGSRPEPGRSFIVDMATKTERILLDNAANPDWKK